MAGRSLSVSQIVVGNPPSTLMEDTPMASPFGVVMGGKEGTSSQPSLNASEVKLAYNMGVWTAQITRMLHALDDSSDAGQSSPGSLPIAIGRQTRSDANAFAASYPH